MTTRLTLMFDAAYYYKDDCRNENDAENDTENGASNDGSYNGDNTSK